MTLVFDRRDALAGKPMTHAFLVGVSDYTHLPDRGQPPTSRSNGLRKLASPALSAWDIGVWLIRNADSLAAPLGTVHLLLSPSALEQGTLQPAPADVAGYIDVAPAAATFDEFEAEAHAWREAASKSPDDATFFYFGGHGIQQFGATLLTLADFAQPLGPILGRSCRFSNVLEGMGPDQTDRPKIARDQFYFIDSCRQDVTDPDLFRSKPSDIWDPAEGVDNRATPAFMASYPGAVALSTPGQRTDFAEALLATFESGAEDSDLQDPQERWPVTSFTLDNALRGYFAAKATGQYAPATGVTFTNVVFRWLDQPPSISFQVQVRPEEQVAATSITLTRADGGFQGAFPAPGLNHPYEVKAQAGIFQLTAQSGAERLQLSRLMNQQRRIWPVKMV